MIFQNFIKLRRQLDWPITFDGDVLRRSRLKPSKAESQGFPSVKEFSKLKILEISVNFEQNAMNYKNFTQFSTLNFEFVDSISNPRLIFKI